jgi:putative ABC transport system permease protein
MAFSLLLLSFLMCIWTGFYIDQGSAQSAERLVVRHKVSLANFIPSYYRQKIRSIPGVVHIVPINWFQGIYKDEKSENAFARFGTDPDEFFDTYKELSIPPDQLEAWKRDRAGAVADVELAKKYGWKIGDRIVIQGDIYPIRLELTLRGLFTSEQPNGALYFNWKYVEEGLPFVKDHDGTFFVLVDSPKNIDNVARAIDAMFANAPEPTKTETEKGFLLSFISMLGNVKLFILVIALASVFTILLVSGNTMAMSVRERTREVAVLKTLGFTRQAILGLFVGESVAIALIGGLVGVLLAVPILFGMSHAPQGGLFLFALREWKVAAPVALIVAVVAGFLSSAIPAYGASRTGIVEGLRHIG